MKPILLILATVLMMACGAGSSTTPAYKLLSAEPGDFGKMSLYVELPSEVSEADLELIAKGLKEEYDGYDRTYIFYMLPGMERNKGAWATSHFTPELKVEIMGITAAERDAATAKPSADAVKDSLASAKVLGHWYEQQMTRMGFMLLEKDHKLFLRISSDVGVIMDREVARTVKQGVTRLDPVELDPNGEYYVIEKSGELGLYSPERRFALAKKVN